MAENIFAESYWSPSETATHAMSDCVSLPYGDCKRKALVDQIMACAARGLIEKRIEPVSMARGTRLELGEFTLNAALILDTEFMFPALSPLQCNDLADSQQTLDDKIRTSYGLTCLNAEDKKGGATTVLRSSIMENNDPQHKKCYVRKIGLYAISQDHDGNTTEIGLRSAVVANYGTLVEPDIYNGGSHMGFPRLVGSTMKHDDGFSRLRRALIVPLPKMSSPQSTKPYDKRHTGGWGRLQAIFH